MQRQQLPIGIQALRKIREPDNPSGLAQVYLLELEVVEPAPEGGALQQIKDRGYADKYRAEGVPIHPIGVDLSRERRTVVGFGVAHLPPAMISAPPQSRSR